MEWMQIPMFPDYSVDPLGRVRNDKTDRIMALQRNQHGVVHVGLVLDGRQYKRSVALLVAQAFLPPPTPPTFNSIIHLDGDLSNCHIDNLMWRPRWFTINYHKQFKGDLKPSINKPLVNTKTGDHFHNSWHAATTYGLIDKEILTCMINRTYVWPTYVQFKVAKE